MRTEKIVDVLNLVADMTTQEREALLEQIGELDEPQAEPVPGPYYLVSHEEVIGIYREWDPPGSGGLRPENTATFGCCHGAHIADVNCSTSGGVATSAQALANATLLAAAPTLVVRAGYAAEVIRGWAESMTDTAVRENPDKRSQEMLAVADSLEGVVAKAMGWTDETV